MRRRRVSLVVVTSLIGLCLAVPASVQAAYPGSNGLIMFASGGTNGNPQDWTQLVSVKPDGSNRTPVAGASGAKLGIAFSPDGKRLAYSTSQPGYPSRIYVAKADGSDYNAVTDGSFGALGPSWSPDGKRLVFQCSNLGGSYGNDLEACALNLETNQMTILTPDDDTPSVAAPAWSPDGNTIALAYQEYVTVDGNPVFKSDIATIPATGGTPVRLNNDLVYDTAPDWSPDGAKIAIARGGGNDSGIAIMDAGGGEPQMLVPGSESGGKYGEPVWSPDGKMLAFHGRNVGGLPQADIFTVVLTSGSYDQLTRVSNDTTYDSLPAWQPIADKHEMKLTFDPARKDDLGLFHYEVQADGFHRSIGTATLKDAKDKPIANEDVLFSPNVLSDPITSDNLRNVMCDATGKRMWPGRYGSGELDFLHKPEATTDSQGKVNFEVLVGSQLGEWLLDVWEKDQDDAKDSRFLESIGAPPEGAVPVGSLLDAFERQLVPETALALPSPEGTRAQKQEALLDWLGVLRYRASQNAAFEPVFNQIEFAPIHADDNTAAGIVFYPARTNPNALLNYMKSGAGSGMSFYVLDVDALQGVNLENNRPHLVLQGDLPTLTEWNAEESEPGVPKHGDAVAGRLAPVSDEDLTYFGYPYPPPAGVPGAGADRGSFDRCISLPGLSATVHSPVNLIFENDNGDELGVDGKGNLKFDAPGVIIGADGDNPSGYSLPQGTYTMRAFGTGAGPATIGVNSAKPGLDNVRVFNVEATKGAKGSLNVSSTGPATTMNFGGDTIKGTPGYKLKLSGLPRKLKPKSTVTLTLTVKDQFGKALDGALVKATAATSVSSLANRFGKVTLRLKTGKAGTRATFTASEPSFVTTTKKVPVKS